MNAVSPTSASEFEIAEQEASHTPWLILGPPYPTMRWWPRWTRSLVQ